MLAMLRPPLPPGVPFVLPQAPPLGSPDPRGIMSPFSATLAGAPLDDAMWPPLPGELSGEGLGLPQTSQVRGEPSIGRWDGGSLQRMVCR